jgi:hypothetical protein
VTANFMESILPLSSLSVHLTFLMVAVIEFASAAEDSPLSYFYR